MDELGILHKTTLTHANIVERFIRSVKKGIGDRIHCTKGKWTDMLNPTLKKYNNSIHSTTGMNRLKHTMTTIELMLKQT